MPLLNGLLQHNLMPQGLGTGGLYTNNFECPLVVSEGQLWYEKVKDWQFNFDQLTVYNSYF
jgi:hypothetical protein